MSTEIDDRTERVLAPLNTTTKRYYLVLGVLLLGALWFAFAWFVQLRYGIGVTGLHDWGTRGGVPWGIYIGAFIWWVGIAHGGIAVSAAVRVFKIERYKPIARIAEVLTVIALGMAAANIIFDLGRPDRILNTLIMWPQTVHHSPLAWDIAVVTLYLVLSLTYLVLSMRDEIHALKRKNLLPRLFAPVYSAILLGYRREESEKVERMLWWLALSILALVALLSGGVVPWLFGLVGAQPGWYGAGTGPAMLIESLTSAIAMVIVVAAAFRYGYGWDDLISDEIFTGLAKVLAFFTIATLWLVLHDVLTGMYSAPIHVEALTETMLAMPLFWLTVVGLALVFVYLSAQILRPSLFTVPRVVASAVVVTLAVLAKKVVFVVEGLMHPTVAPLSNLYPTGTYSPTWVEWSLLLGTIVVAALLFAVAVKVLPMLEIEPEEVEA